MNIICWWIELIFILLKDFEVGKIYKKKVILINVFYIVNYCKYINIIEMLKDFIEI